MKRRPLILIVSIIALVSLAQYKLIISSLISLAAWCALEAGHRAPLGSYWNPALFEYWVAGIIWVLTALWLLRSVIVPPRSLSEKSIFPESTGESEQDSIIHRVPKPLLRHTPRMRRRERTLGVGAPSMIGPSRGVSSQIIGIIGCVALMSPFLTPVDPNVQGSLVTTRLLPPLSKGYVREFLDPGSPGPQTAGPAYRMFAEANNYLLHRTVLLSGGPHTALSTEGQRVGVAIREFPTVFLFGTDDNGRDVFSRVVTGTRVSLGIGLSAALGALLIGAAVGFAAGMSRGFLDGMLMRLTDLFLAIPGLFLVIGVLAFVGQSIMTIVVVLALSGWMGIARVVRGEVVSLREREFILAAKLLRVSSWRIVTRHLLPNLRPVLLTAAVLQFANAVLGEASLGFLGLGIQPPTATWGNMMGEATGYLGSAWWVGVFPGLLLAVVLVSAHSLGENLAADGGAAAPRKSVT